LGTEILLGWLFVRSAFLNLDNESNFRIDTCGIGYSDKLEKLQLDAARIVAGLSIFTKSEYLYAETGLETLSERRYRRKL
jgi:hypothetical protein